MKFCRKHLVIQKNLAQKSKKSDSEGYPQADEGNYYASSNGELHATASSKYENIHSHPTELVTSSYSVYNNLHSFTTSFADANEEQLNIQVPFNTDSIFFVCDNSTSGHICNDLLMFIP